MHGLPGKNRLDPIWESRDCQVAGILITTRKDKRHPHDEGRDINENIKIKVWMQQRLSY